MATGSQPGAYKTKAMSRDPWPGAISRTTASVICGWSSSTSRTHAGKTLASSPSERRISLQPPTPDDRHRPGQTKLYRLVQRHAPTFFTQTEDAAGAIDRFAENDFLQTRASDILTASRIWESAHAPTR